MARSTVITKFSTPKVARELNFTIGKAMRQVGKEMANEIRGTLQAQYPPASAPGTPPHRRSGVLQASVRGDGDSKGIRIREVQYGFYLESGTANMDPRPHVRPVLFTGKNTPRKKWEKRIAQIARSLLGKR